MARGPMMPEEMIFGEFGSPLYLGDLVTTNEGAIMGKLTAIDGETIEIDLGDGVIMRAPAVDCSLFDQS